MSLGVGQLVLGRYVIDDVLGEGGMGRVYLAHHRRLDFPVVIKAMIDHSNPEIIQRFIREAELMAVVRHPNVVAVHDYGVLEGGGLCIAMERIDGSSLEAVLQQDGALRWPEAVRITLQVLLGLAAVHDAGVLHRDLKPANVVLCPGDPSQVKLIDFGIAKPISKEGWHLTKAGQATGTPAYMAPEVILGEPADPRADIYSTGLLLYELLAGGLPFADSARPLMNRLTKPAPPLQPLATETVPAALDEILARSLSLFPEQRPASARALIRDLQAVVDAAAPEARPRAPSQTRAAIADRTTLPQRPPAAPATIVDPRPPEHVEASPEPPDTLRAMPWLEPDALRPLDEPDDNLTFVLVAVLPPSRIARPEERSWLDSRLDPKVRAVVVGAHVWMVWGKGQDANAPERLRAELTDRYGPHTRMTWRSVPSDFTVSARAAVGAGPMPDPVPELIDELHQQD